jgi:hypothetical protein
MTASQIQITLQGSSTQGSIISPEKQSFPTIRTVAATPIAAAHQTAIHFVFTAAQSNTG